MQNKANRTQIYCSVSLLLLFLLRLFAVSSFVPPKTSNFVQFAVRFIQFMLYLSSLFCSPLLDGICSPFCNENVTCLIWFAIYWKWNVIKFFLLLLGQNSHTKWEGTENEYSGKLRFTQWRYSGICACVRVWNEHGFSLRFIRIVTIYVDFFFTCHFFDVLFLLLPCRFSLLIFFDNVCSSECVPFIDFSNKHTTLWIHINDSEWVADFFF